MQYGDQTCILRSGLNTYFSTFYAVSGEPVHRPIVYSRDQLLALSTAAVHANLDGFQLQRADRIVESGKRKGGGLAVFVNDSWWAHHC